MTDVLTIHPLTQSIQSFNDTLQTILVGGSVVAAGLIGFYYTMLANKKREQAAGRNPYRKSHLIVSSTSPLVLSFFSRRSFYVFSLIKQTSKW